jgi:uncharacterized phage protein gp47/JayE
MSRTPDQVSADILAKLAITDPALSLEIGTPERKLVDACAEAISECYIDNYLLGFSLDIDTKAGTDLDNFVGIFGFARQAGRYSTGVVTFSLAYPATTDTQITIGQQVFVPASTTGTTDLYFVTTQYATISLGTQTTTVAVQCQTVGTVGNVASTSVTGYQGGFGVAQVTNPSPMTGGMDPETDDQLRARFKATFLRNIAGTQGFYAAMMIQNKYTSNANVVGPYQIYREEIQFNGTNKVFSTNPDCKYTWPVGWWLYRDQGLPTEVFYNSGIDYIVDTSVLPPGITPIHPDLTAAGATADFEYQYTTTASRNDPANGIANKVDLYIDGTDTTDVYEQIIAGSTTFNTTAGSLYNTANFLRADRTAVVSGHTFQPLGSVPIVAFPNQIYSTTTTYNSGVDFIGVNDVTLNQGSRRELSGVEWLTSTPPAAGTMLTADYTYNRNPELMQALMSAQKQLTTDVLVHQNVYRNLFFSLVISYNYAQDVTSINNTITNALTQWCTNGNFGQWVQMSDIIQQVHNVTGVDNCRIATVNDVSSGAAYGIASRFNGTVLTTFTRDFRLNDNELMAFDGLQIIRRAQNTFYNGA